MTQWDPPAGSPMWVTIRIAALFIRRLPNPIRRFSGPLRVV